MCHEAGRERSRQTVGSRTCISLCLIQLDERRIEIYVDGLSLFHGVQLAVDFTLVFALRRDGGPSSSLRGMLTVPSWRRAPGGGKSTATPNSAADRGRGRGGCDGATPTTSDVVCDCRHYGM